MTVPLPLPAMQERNPYSDLGPMDPHTGKDLLEWYDVDQMRAYGDARAAEAAAQEREAYAELCEADECDFLARSIRAREAP